MWIIFYLNFIGFYYQKSHFILIHIINSASQSNTFARRIFFPQPLQRWFCHYKLSKDGAPTAKWKTIQYWITFRMGNMQTIRIQKVNKNPSFLFSESFDRDCHSVLGITDWALGLSTRLNDNSYFELWGFSFSDWMIFGMKRRGKCFPMVFWW